jgi:hypothetical protein
VLQVKLEGPMFEHLLLEFLDSEVEFLLRLEDIEFLRELRPFVRTLEAEPRIRAALAEIRQETFDRIAGHSAYDAATVKELVALRDEFARLAPDADDSGTPTPEGGVDPILDFSLARFDRIVAMENFHGRMPDRTKTAALIRILSNRIEDLRWPWQGGEGEPKTKAREDQRPSLAPVEVRLTNLSNQHQQRHRRFEWENQTSPGIELLSIEKHLLEMDPDPVVLPPDDVAGQERVRTAEMQRMFLEAFTFGTRAHSLREAMVTRERLTDQQTAAAKYAAEKLRLAVRRLHAELRRRAWWRRSLRALFSRFKQRCELHDQQRLFKLAEDNPGKVEEVLTRELVLWLFDQGLSPITKPRLKLEPDIIDPSLSSNLYVEVKQYDRADRRRLVEGIAVQLWETAHLQRGTRYEAMEAFYVVFRCGGPLYEFPARVVPPGEEWAVYPFVVDISPADARGSRGRSAPERISEDELLPKLGDGGTESAPAGPDDGKE